MLLDSRSRGKDGGETTDFFCELMGHDTCWDIVFGLNQPHPGLLQRGGVADFAGGGDAGGVRGFLLF